MPVLAMCTRLATTSCQERHARAARLYATRVVDFEKCVDFESCIQSQMGMQQNCMLSPIRFIALAGVEGPYAARSAHKKDVARTSLANEYKLTREETKETSEVGRRGYIDLSVEVCRGLSSFSRGLTSVEVCRCSWLKTSNISSSRGFMSDRFFRFKSRLNAQ